MTFRKRKKNSRQRGGTTHGWGAMKKHRGSGNRGGVGMAGTGKRGDSKKPSNWKEKYFGKFGFKKKGQVEKIITVNISELQDRLDALLAKKLIEKKGDVYEIDAEKLGYNKVLGTGKLTKKMSIKAPYFSAKAIERIESAGGKAIREETTSKEPEAE